MINTILMDDWEGEPPNIYAISKPMPSAPYLWLSGGGTARMSLDSYLKDLQKDFVQQSGKYFVFVKGSEGEEADTFALKTWDVYTSPTSCYEAMIVLYYAPINEYLCLKKHMGDKWAQQYLDEIAKRERAIASLENLM